MMMGMGFASPWVVMEGVVFVSPWMMRGVVMEGVIGVVGADGGDVYKPMGGDEGVVFASPWVVLGVVMEGVMGGDGGGDGDGDGVVMGW